MKTIEIPVHEATITVAVRTEQVLRAAEGFPAAKRAVEKQFGRGCLDGIDELDPESPVVSYTLAMILHHGAGGNDMNGMDFVSFEVEVDGWTDGLAGTQWPEACTDEKEHDQ